MKLLLLTLIACLLLLATQAQDSLSQEKVRIWCDIDGGITNLGGGFGVALKVNKKKMIYTFRGLITSDQAVFSQKEFGCVSFMLGHEFLELKKRHSLSVSGGFGLASYGSDSQGMLGSEKRKQNALAVSTELVYTWRPFKFFGTGVKVFGDLNKAKSIAGAMLVLQFGRFR